jgi:hypothetical protein
LAPVQTGPTETRSTWEQGAALRTVSSAEPLMELHLSECSPTPRNTPVTPSLCFDPLALRPIGDVTLRRVQVLMAPPNRGEGSRVQAGSVQPIRRSRCCNFHPPAEILAEYRTRSRRPETEPASPAAVAGRRRSPTNEHRWPWQPVNRRSRRAFLRMPRCTRSRRAGVQCGATSAHSYRTLKRDG